MPVFTDVVFTNSPRGISAAKLNLLRDDLSAAISAGGGGSTGTGDMTKAVYDTNNNGKVDTCDSLAWTSVSGKPSTFPPDNTAMLKSVYDTNADNIVDHAAVSDAVPWAGITGKPSTFPPDSTAMLKSVYDTNNNGVADTCDSLPWTSITGKPAGSLVDPGVWTTLSLGSGWTAPVQAQYRLEVNGAVSVVHFRGMLSATYASMGTTAFTAPVGARPSMTRSVILGGSQTLGSDVASYVAQVATSGVATIYFLGAGPFTWADPAQTQNVYLDGLSYSL